MFVCFFLLIFVHRLFLDFVLHACLSYCVFMAFRILTQTIKILFDVISTEN